VAEHVAPDEALRAFLHSYKSVVSRLEQSFASSGAPGLFESVLLTRLYRSEGQRMRMQDAGTYLVITKSGISRMIDRMVEAGYVERQDWDEDRRVTFIVMTDLGRDALRHSAAVYRQAFAQTFMSRLSEEELFDLVVLLRKLGTASDLDGATAADALADATAVS
jgi:DNA-binding MarR family transcriptional regulator